MTCSCGTDLHNLQLVNGHGSVRLISGILHI